MRVRTEKPGLSFGFGCIQKPQSPGADVGESRRRCGHYNTPPLEPNASGERPAAAVPHGMPGLTENTVRHRSSALHGAGTTCGCGCGCDCGGPAPFRLAATTLPCPASQVAAGASRHDPLRPRLAAAAAAVHSAHRNVICCMLHAMYDVACRTARAAWMDIAGRATARGSAQRNAALCGFRVPVAGCAAGRTERFDSRTNAHAQAKLRWGSERSSCTERVP